MTTTIPIDHAKLEKAIAHLQSVYQQTTDLRVATTTDYEEFGLRFAPDEHAMYRHHFNNTVTFFHNEIGKLSAAQIEEDPEFYRETLTEAVTEIISRKIEDGNWNLTDMRGYAETATPLIATIERQIKSGALKGEDVEIATAFTGNLKAVMANQVDLLMALDGVITLLPPEKTIDTAQIELLSDRDTSPAIG